MGAILTSDGVEIAYSVWGRRDGSPVLMIQGLGVDHRGWGLQRGAFGRRHRCIAVDNRGTGHSDAPAGPYDLSRMADDAIAVLDALGWKRAHLFGASLGGIIAQRIALRHPDRVLSVVSAAGMPSDTSGLGAGRYVRFGMLARLARMKFPEGRDGDIQMSLALARAVASPAYPFNETATREWIEREVDSGPRDTKAQSRQAGAGWHGPKLRELRKPTLVLHGDHDPLLRVSAARDTAKAVAGARLVLLPGAGHDLPEPLWGTIADEVRRNADRAVARQG
jgi:pimeloyl-ACP methyl ester carboxylesterase